MLPSSHDPRQWYALQVRSRKEYQIASVLEQKGYEYFLPTIPAAGERPRPATPVFEGYLFCRINMNDRSAPVVATPGVIRILGYGPTPAPIPDAEIDALKRTWEAKVPATLLECFHTGQRIRITTGVLTGVEGILSERRCDRKIVLQVSLLQRSLAVDVDLSSTGILQLSA